MLLRHQSTSGEVLHPGIHTITCRTKIGSGAAAPLSLPILYVKRGFLFPGLA